jgi:hypothetical protein
VRLLLDDDAVDEVDPMEIVRLQRELGLGRPVRDAEFRARLATDPEVLEIGGVGHRDQAGLVEGLLANRTVAREPWRPETPAGHAGKLEKPNHLVLVSPVGVLVLLGDQCIDDVSPGLVAET